jgi:hypothetical protein
MISVLSVVAVLAALVVGEGTASATTMGSYITKGKSINAGNSIDYGGRQLILQTDGNLVLYNNGVNPRTVCWASATSGSGRSHAVATYQSDGNFVVYNGTQVLWASNTVGDSGTTVDLESYSGKVAWYVGYTRKAVC